MLNPIFYRANIIRKWITDPEKLTDLQKNSRENVNAQERGKENVGQIHKDTLHNAIQILQLMILESR